MALKLSKVEKWVRVYPTYNGNWDDPDPISMEMKALGYETSIRFLSRIRSEGGKESRNERTDRAIGTIKSKLKSAVRSGSITGVYDEDTGEPVTTVDRFLSMADLAGELLFELEQMADDKSMLMSRGEEEWKKYRDERTDEGATEAAVDREQFGDPVGNSN